MPTNCVGNPIKAQLTYASDFPCQQPGLSKYQKIWHSTTNGQKKLLILKPKFLSFYITDFPDITFPRKKQKKFLVSGQARALNLRLLLWWTSKPERLTLSNDWTKAFWLSKGATWQWLLANQLGGFICNIRCQKWFFSKLLQKVQLACLPKSIFFEKAAFGHVTKVSI